MSVKDHVMSFGASAGAGAIVAGAVGAGIGFFPVVAVTVVGVIAVVAFVTGSNIYAPSGEVKPFSGLMGAFAGAALICGGAPAPAVPDATAAPLTAPAAEGADRGVPQPPVRTLQP